jgi:hypothetical protein
MKRERLRYRERLPPYDWKVHKHIEDPWTMSSTTDSSAPSPARCCGSSIAHGRCVYAGRIASGVTQCDARAFVWNGCPFKGVHTPSSAIAQSDEELA